MGSTRSNSGFSVIEGGARKLLLAVCVTAFTPTEIEAHTALSSAIEVVPIRDAEKSSLAALCRRHGCTLADAAVIATRPQDLPWLLEAHTALALEGAGYENETAADRVFPPRSAGGLVQAIRYVGTLVAGR